MGCFYCSWAERGGDSCNGPAVLEKSADMHTEDFPGATAPPRFHRGPVIGKLVMRIPGVTAPARASRWQIFKENSTTRYPQPYGCG